MFVYTSSKVLCERARQFEDAQDLRTARPFVDTIMAAMFEPSLSTSAMRAPLPTADAPSMADSLPAINFGFDELRERMARFTEKFDAFVAQGRKRVLEERNQFRINVAELQGTLAFKSRIDSILMPYI